mmetsp:Transcript_30201/g.34573  ORF Transcript_30201/g.34573 Transcript_30201/m.34573 type:complete len:98 (+) Transcript_30201:376-669(+)
MPKMDENTNSFKVKSETTSLMSQRKEDNNDANRTSGNSKQTSSTCDAFIAEVKYKAKATKRHRVMYKCTFDGCNKKCQKRWNLVDHVKVHLGIFPFE